jgi:hypothetical protein
MSSALRRAVRRQNRYAMWLQYVLILFSPFVIGIPTGHEFHSFSAEILELFLTCTNPNTVKPGYNDIGFYDTSPIMSDLLWYQLIPQC